MLFDAHADILTDMYQEHEKGLSPSFQKRHLDSYKKAGITHSIFVNWTNPNTTDPLLFDKIFDHAFQELEQSKDLFHICRSVDDLQLATDSNKLGVIIGMEGIMQLKDVEQLRDLYQKGVRHASLTWNEVNKYAAGLNSETEGLTLLGKEILTEMQTLGMVIDLAHSNPRSFQEIIQHTTGPIIVSHGNVKALCNHKRNYTDDQLLQIKNRNGVIGICAIASFISEYTEFQTVQEMAKHIDYAVQLIGIDHVGVGFDICYYLDEGSTNNRVAGFQTISDANNVFIELQKLGYSEAAIQKIKFGNFARVLQEVWR